MGFEPVLEAAEAEERLVDRVDFELRREVGKRPHHPRAHVAVEGVVAGTDDDTLRVHARAADMPGLAHGDAERLGFVGAGDHAAVVVRQHHHGLAAQGRLKHPLA